MSHDSHDAFVPSVAPRSGDDADGLKSLVAGEQVRALYSQSVPVLMANFVNAVIVSALLWTSIDPALLCGWCVAMLAMCLVRLEMRRRYWKADPAPEDTKRWARYFVVGSASAGVIWGFAGFALLVPQSLPLQLLVAFVIGGMGAGAAGALSCYLPAFFAYFVPSTVPLVVRLLLEGERLHLGMGAMVALYFVGLAMVAVNSNRSLRSAFALRFRNAALLEQVGRTQRGLEQAKRSLETRVAERTADLEQQRRCEQTLAKIGRDALRMRNLSALLELATRAIAKALRVSHAAVCQFEGEQGSVRLRAGVGWKEDSIGRRWDPADWAADAASFRPSTQPVLLEDLAERPDRNGFAALREQGIRSGLSVCIFCSEAPFGRLGVYSGQPRRFSGAEASFLRAAATLLANAVERSQADLALRRSEQNFAALVLGSPDVILTLDTKGVITSSNPAAKRTLGYAPAELEGKTLVGSRLLADADRERLERELLALFGGEERPPLELTMQRSDGQPVEVEVNQRLLRRDDGTPFVQAIIRDASERKRAEKMRSELELQLRQTQRLESIGRFAGGVAHDFNNLLTVILNNLSLVESDRTVAGSTRVLLDEVSQAAARAAALTHQILAFSRNQVLETRVVDTNEIVMGIEAVLRRLVGESIQLDLRLARETTAVRADPTQLEQVVLNLVANGRDAMPDGGTLTIETTCVDLDDDAAHQMSGGIAPGRYVALTVSDTGTGMDEETLQRLFEPFFTTKGPQKGTGLGLATAHGIVTQSGGTIALRSKVGEGSHVTVYLPHTPECVAPRTTSAPRSTVTAGRQTVLVVEDERLVQQAARRVLQRAGFRVLVAGDGAEALGIFSDSKADIDLVLTDVVMPKMNGPTLARRIEDLRPGTKVLFVSGYTGDELSEAGAESERVNFLQKPFKPAELVDKVRAVLQQ